MAMESEITLRILSDSIAIEEGLERDERDPNDVVVSTSKCRSGKPPARKNPVNQADDDEGAEAVLRLLY